MHSRWKKNEVERLNTRTYESEQALHEYSDSSGLTPIETELMQEFFSPGGPVLDLGCGTGRTTDALADLGYPVVGVDLSKMLLQRATARSPEIPFIQSDARRLPIQPDQFTQALFSFNGFDHVYPQGHFVDALSGIKKVLKPGGLFIYSGHNIFGRFGRDLRRPLKQIVSNAARVHSAFLALQRHGSHLSQWYWRYHEPFGDLVIFSAPPWVHRRLHTMAGFETLAVRGPKNETSTMQLTWTEHHIHYVVRKPH